MSEWRRGDEPASRVPRCLQLFMRIELEPEGCERMDEMPIGNGASQLAGELAGFGPIGNGQARKGELAERPWIAERRRSFLALDGLCELALRPKRFAAVVERLRVVRVDCQDAVVAGNGLVVAT